MAWDNSRPVPWRRLIREWLIYAVIMVFVFLVFFRDGGAIGAISGVLVSGPLYLGFGSILAKFGYQRKTLKELRTPQASSSSSSSSSSSEPTEDQTRRPAPTRRTSGGGNRPRSKKRR